MDNYESAKEERNWKAFSTPAEREEYRSMLKQEARDVMKLPLSARNDHYKKAEKEYGKGHVQKLVSEVKKQRGLSRGMEM